MALYDNELTNSTTLERFKRVQATSIQPRKFAAGSGTIKKMTPVAFNEATQKWVVWASATSEISTITANATTATDGTFTISVDGETTAAIAHDANAAAIKAALEALSNIAPGDVTVVDADGGLAANSGSVTITFGGNWTGKAVVVSADFTGLTGNDHTLAETQAGADSNGVNKIQGFLWPHEQALVADKEVQANVMLAGILHIDDVEVPAGESKAGISAAMIRDGLRSMGFTVQGIENWR